MGHLRKRLMEVDGQTKVMGRACGEEGLRVCFLADRTDLEEVREQTTVLHPTQLLVGAG